MLLPIRAGKPLPAEQATRPEARFPRRPEQVETPSANREPWITALRDAGWDLAVDRIIRGLCHDLAGRASALAGLTYLLTDRDESAEGIPALLNQELDQLDEVVRLLRLLPNDAMEGEILPPGEMLPDLSLLVRSQRGLEDVEIVLETAPNAPAVRMDRTLFIRSLHLLLTGAAEKAVLAGGGKVVVQAGAEGSGLTLALTPCPWAVNEEGVDPGVLPERIVTEGRMRRVVEILGTRGVRGEALDQGYGAGTLRLRYPPPFPPPSPPFF